MNLQAKYLLSLPAIRERASIVAKAAKAGKLSHFDFHENRLDRVADFVTSVIKRDFGPDNYDAIPPHGRWQHFEIGNVPRIDHLLDDLRANRCDEHEQTRCLIDLFFVSVLLDAGAGDHWRYVEPQTQNEYERSEGIAVASLHMFNSMAFSSSKSSKVPQVDGQGLVDLTTEDLAKGFQISDSNPMLGIDSRAGLLRSLGQSLLKHANIFGIKGRPGNIVDYMLNTKGEGSTDIDVLIFWDILQELLIPCWPTDRTTVGGEPIGDAWPLSTLQRETSSDDPTAGIHPFHKLTQWLTYSLMVPFQRVLKLNWVNSDSLTALAEYRNGGLFVDLGVLSLKPEALEQGRKMSGQDLPLFGASDDVIVEWRSMTIVLLDMVYEMVLERMNGVHLSIAQMLEAGTWKSGREIAAKRRPDTKSSPILIQSDGTLF